MFLKITNLGRSCKVAEHGRIYDVGLFRVTVSLNLSCISHNSRLSLNFTPSPIHNPSASLLPSVPPLLLPIYPNLCHSTLSLISSPSIPKHPSSFPPCSPPPNLHPVSLSLSVSLSVQYVCVSSVCAVYVRSCACTRVCVCHVRVIYFSSV